MLSLHATLETLLVKSLVGNRRSVIEIDVVWGTSLHGGVEADLLELVLCYRLSR